MCMRRLGKQAGCESFYWIVVRASLESYSLIMLNLEFAA